MLKLVTFSLHVKAVCRLENSIVCNTVDVKTGSNFFTCVCYVSSFSIITEGSLLANGLAY